MVLKWGSYKVKVLNIIFLTAVILPQSWLAFLYLRCTRELTLLLTAN